ncbi:MAG: hypothetical protein QOJ54_3196, partial [Aliidongia sp.]|nr:hypothetical protein [Aliidongia sp.]
MLVLLGFNLLFILVLFGWGGLAAATLERAAGIGLRGGLAVGEYGLLGLALLAPIGLVLHGVMALDGWFGLGVSIVGCVSLICNRRRLLAAATFGLARGWSGVLLAALFVLVVGTTVQQRMPYDSGLYHLQTILMAEDSRIVLGAANIHTRFGYNSAWLILCAMFSLPGRPLGGAIGLNGVICFLVMSGMVQRVGAGVGRSGSSPSAVFAGASVLLIALAKLLPHNVGGPSTDLPAGLLTIYTFLLMLVLVEEVPVDRLEDRSLGTLLIAFPIGALAIICKSSQLPVALAVVFVAAAIGSWRHTSGRRVVCVGAASAAILATAWVLHGLALSGCLFYPVSRSCVAILPWTIPSTMADHDLAWITSFARIPTVKNGLVPDDWHWLPVWLHEIRGERLVVALKAVFGLCLLSGAIRLGAGRQVRCLGETLDSAGNKA